MRSRTLLLVAALAAAAGLMAAAAGATVGIYRNDMGTVAKRSQLLELHGRNCERGGSELALRVEVGKRTADCTYRTPVVGRDLEILATERLLSGTPRAMRRKTFLTLNLRTGGGGGYQLAVFPLQRKFQLRKNLSDGTREYLAVGRHIARIRGIDEANQLRLRAFNMLDTPEKDDVRLLVYIGPKRVANVIDDEAGPLDGRFSGVGVGANGSASGAVASFDDIVVRVPNPF